MGVGQGGFQVVAVVSPLFPVVGGGVGAGGQSFAQAWGPVAQADVPKAPYRVGELTEPKVLAGDLKVDQPAWRSRV
ncbi:MAG: hypothetical protein ACR2P2_06335, partial [Nakamurella sp.]